MNRIIKFSIVTKKLQYGNPKRFYLDGQRCSEYNFKADREYLISKGMKEVLGEVYETQTSIIYRGKFLPTYIG